jgi:hypothetical protein
MKSHERNYMELYVAEKYGNEVSLEQLKTLHLLGPQPRAKAKKTLRDVDTSRMSLRCDDA